MLVNYQMSEGRLPPASDQDNPVLVHPPGGVPQCPPPLLGILLTSVHDVLGIEVNHLLKPDGVDIYRLVIFRWLINIDQS